MGRNISALEVERTLSAVAGRALGQGARAGLRALVEAAVRLMETSGAALYADGVRVARVGLAPPPPARAHPLQLLKEGPTTLVLGEPCLEAAERQLLTRLAVLGSELLACRAREDAARDERVRLRRERMRVAQVLSHRERAWTLAAHDLRTPLLVLQGYIDMMARGMSGPLTPAMRRYLERMSRAAGEMGTRLQQRPSGEEVPVEDLRPLLAASFGPGGRVPARLELPEGPVSVRASRSEVALLVRTLARMLAGVTEVVLRVDARDGGDGWRLLVRGRAEHPLSERASALLERLARRMGASLSLQEDSGLELTLRLPRG